MALVFQSTACPNGSTGIFGARKYLAINVLGVNIVRRRKRRRKFENTAAKNIPSATLNLLSDTIITITVPIDNGRPVL